MSLKWKTTAPLMVVVVILSIVGCGRSGGTHNTDPAKDELADIYETYTEYVKNNKKPPQRLSDLKRYETVHTLALRVLNEGRYVVVWGVNSKDSATVLAYPKDAPPEGGQVLMADGTIKSMTAAEVSAAAPKADKK